MLSKIGKYLLYTLVWGIVVGYVVYSATLARTHRKEQIIEHIEISILDSAMYGNLITTEMVQRWITKSEVQIMGSSQDELKLKRLKDYMLENRFVKGVNLYPSYSGTLHVELTQHHPSMRLLMDGYDGYVTREGYLFTSPPLSSLYVPVVTGGYRPPFPSLYQGLLSDFELVQSRHIEAQISSVEREKYPLYVKQRDMRDSLKGVLREFIDKGWFESEEHFDARVDSLRAKKSAMRQWHRYQSRVVAKQIDKLTQKQQSLIAEQKKLQKKCEDFTNLVNFAHIVDMDKFWGAEVVQIIARESQSGGLHTSLMVRSCDAEIIFGEISSREEIEQRLEKLYDFYQKGLSRVGWSRYKTINVEYKDQVVCK